MRSARRHRAGQAVGPRLGFYGVLGSGSIGNDGSLDAILRHLRTTRPDAQLRFLVMGPERLEARYGAQAEHLQWFEAHVDRLHRVPSALLKIVGRLADPVRTLRWVRAQDVVLVPGMGVLETTIPIRPWGFPYGLLALCVAGRLTGKPVLFVGVGADMVGKPLTRWMITTSARLASYRSYRDENSRQAMGRMGVDVSEDEVFPDLAFSHPVPVHAPDGSRAVGLGLMDYEGNNDEREQGAELHRAYVEAMTRFATWVVDEGRPIRFYTCDPIDSPVVERVMRDVRTQRPDLHPDMLVAEPSEDLQELLKRMATVDAVVATRYHNVVGAVQLSMPTISISYSRKHDELMERMGLGAFCQPARAVVADRLIEQFRELERRSKKLTHTMEERNHANVVGARAQLAAVDAVLQVALEGSAAGGGTPSGSAPGLAERVPEAADG